MTSQQFGFFIRFINWLDAWIMGIWGVVCQRDCCPRPILFILVNIQATKPNFYTAQINTQQCSEAAEVMFGGMNLKWDIHIRKSMNSS